MPTKKKSSSKNRTKQQGRQRKTSSSQRVQKPRAQTGKQRMEDEGGLEGEPQERSGRASST